MRRHNSNLISRGSRVERSLRLLACPTWACCARPTRHSLLCNEQERGALESFITEFACAGGNDRPIWLLIDFKAARRSTPVREREEVERGRCVGVESINRHHSFVGARRASSLGTFLYMFTHTCSFELSGERNSYHRSRTQSCPRVCEWQPRFVAVRSCRRSDPSSATLSDHRRDE